MAILKQKLNEAWVDVPLGATCGVEARDTEPTNPMTQVWIDTSDTEVIADYVVEQGTDGIWTYEKWASGKAVCWGHTSVNVGTSIASNSFITIVQALPSNLFLTIKSGTCDCTIYESSTGYALNFTCTPNFNNDKVGGYLWNSTGGGKAIGSYTIYMSVTGTWK